MGTAPIVAVRRFVSWQHASTNRRIFIAMVVVGAVLNDSRGEVERYGNNDYYGYPSSYAKSKTPA